MLYSCTRMATVGVKGLTDYESARYVEYSPDGAAVNVVGTSFTQPAGTVVDLTTLTAACHNSR